MFNWRVFLESQDPEPELELSLSQLPNQLFQPLQPPCSLDHLNEESGHVSISFGMEIFKKTPELW
jgi:hypothetical protein